MDLRIGVVGFGERGHSLAEEAHRPGDGARIVGICDTSERSRAEARERYPDAVVTGSLQELLDADVDAVMVFTPDGQHAGVTVVQLRATP